MRKSCLCSQPRGTSHYRLIKAVEGDSLLEASLWAWESLGETVSRVPVPGGSSASKVSTLAVARDTRNTASRLIDPAVPVINGGVCKISIMVLPRVNQITREQPCTILPSDRASVI